jgi:hypothetical protein
MKDGTKFQDADSKAQTEYVGSALKALGTLGDIMGSDDYRELLSSAEQFSQGDFSVDPDKFRENIRRMSAAAAVMNVDGKEFMQTAAQIQKDAGAAAGLGLAGNANALQDSVGRTVGAFGSLEYASKLTQDVYAVASMQGDMSRENVQRIQRNQAALNSNYYGSSGGKQAVLMTHLLETGRIDQDMFDEYKKSLESGTTYEQADNFNRALRASGLGEARGNQMLRNDATMAELGRSLKDSARLNELTGISYGAMSREARQRTMEGITDVMGGEINSLRRDFRLKGTVTDKDMTESKRKSMASYLRGQGKDDLARLVENQGGGSAGLDRLMNSEAFRVHKVGMEAAVVQGQADLVTGALNDPNTARYAAALSVGKTVTYKDKAKEREINRLEANLRRAKTPREKQAAYRALRAAHSADSNAFMDKESERIQEEIDQRKSNLEKSSESLSKKGETVLDDAITRSLLAGKSGMTGEYIKTADNLAKVQESSKTWTSLLDRVAGKQNESEDEKLRRSTTALQAMGKLASGDPKTSVLDLFGVGDDNATRKKLKGTPFENIKNLEDFANLTDDDLAKMTKGKGLTDDEQATLKAMRDDAKVRRGMQKAAEEKAKKEKGDTGKSESKTDTAATSEDGKADGKDGTGSGSAVTDGKLSGSLAVTITDPKGNTVTGSGELDGTVAPS